MNELQRAARTRKLVYLGLIVALFTASMFWRGKFAVGNPAADPPTALDRIAKYTIEGQAAELELAEGDLGDQEFAGSAFRVGLVGFRGVVVTYLWSSAIEKQKRHEYPEYELRARLVTRLQPNFITPWLFQGWNLTYNVSVENDKLGDSFFFIARGMELLAEGDRLNTKTVRRRGQVFLVGVPDIRKDIAFFYQNKFTVSDKVTTLRCLMHLCAMKPSDRAPARILKQNSTEVNAEAFRAFCEENPQLVRRLVTPRFDVTLNKSVAIASSPAEIADFLAANIELPSRWEKDQLKPDDAQFPTLPPAFAENTEYHPNHPDLKDGKYDRFDALVASRAWAQYAQLVVPPPPRDSNGVAFAAAAPKRAKEFDPSDPDAEYKYRMPISPTLIIFRYMPARAQTYLAKRLQDEGWYDAETRWDPDLGRPATARWFPAGSPGLKAGRDSLAEYGDARNRWELYGKSNGLLPSPAQEAAMKAAVVKTLPFFRASPNLPADLSADELAQPEYGLSPEQQEAIRAALTEDDLRMRKAAQYLPQNLQVTNFLNFFESAQAEADRGTVTARKQLREAEGLKDAGQLSAKEAFAQAIAEWRRVLQKQSAYHTNERSDEIHQFTFDIEQKLVNLWKDEPAVVAEASAALAAAPVLALSQNALLQALAEERTFTEIAVRMRMLDAAGLTEAKAREDVAGSFAYLKKHTDGSRRTAWVRPDVRDAKLEALGLVRKPPPPAPTTGPDGQPLPIPQAMPKQ